MSHCYVSLDKNHAEKIPQDAASGVSLMTFEASSFLI